MTRRLGFAERVIERGLQVNRGRVLAGKLERAIVSLAHVGRQQTAHEIVAPYQQAFPAARIAALLGQLVAERDFALARKIEEVIQW